MKPLTQYAKSEEINIAYQVIGQGSIDIVFVPGWVSNIDILWEDSKISNFLTKLSEFTRLILFDKRGTGLSDKVSSLCSLEERMDDIRNVMDAVNSKKAILFGHSEGGTISCLFAATYPERTISLITFGAFAKRIFSNDYPWAPKPAERKIFYKTIKEGWGNGQKLGLEYLMPSMANDQDYYNWFASYLRSAASPGTALALAMMNTEADITNILDVIKVPTLILHRTHDKDVNIEEAKYLEKRIPNSKLIELNGSDHLFWIGDAYSVMVEIEDFITGKRQTKYAFRVANISKSDIETIMKQNFKHHIKIEDYAKLCGRSLSTFKRDFKSQLNSTPSNWLMAKRLEFAKKLLLETDLNINEICFESGFKNTSHFIRAFKSKYTLTPKKFKIAFLKK